MVHSSGGFTSLGFLGLMQGVTEQLCSCVWLSLQRVVVWKAIRLKSVSMVVDGDFAATHKAEDFSFQCPGDAKEG